MIRQFLSHPPRDPGSVREAREGGSPQAPASLAQVQPDEEADDERHRAEQGAGVCGAAGIQNCGGNARGRPSFSRRADAR